jgi:hypothetical protein
MTCGAPLHAGSPSLGSPFAAQAAKGGLESLSWTPKRTNRSDCVEPVYYLNVVDPQDRSQAWASPSFNISTNDNALGPKLPATPSSSDSASTTSLSPSTPPPSSADPAATTWPSALHGQPGGTLTTVQGIGIGFGTVLASVVVAILLKCWVFPWIRRSRAVARRYGAELD